MSEFGLRPKPTAIRLNTPIPFTVISKFTQTNEANILTLLMSALLLDD